MVVFFFVEGGLLNKKQTLNKKSFLAVTFPTNTTLCLKLFVFFDEQSEFLFFLFLEAFLNKNIDNRHKAPNDKNIKN